MPQYMLILPIGDDRLLAWAWNTLDLDRAARAMVTPTYGAPNAVHVHDGMIDCHYMQFMLVIEIREWNPSGVYIV